MNRPARDWSRLSNPSKTCPCQLKICPSSETLKKWPRAHSATTDGKKLDKNDANCGTLNRHTYRAKHATGPVKFRPIVVDHAVIDSCVVFHRISILFGPEDAQITIETDDNKKIAGCYLEKSSKKLPKRRRCSSRRLMLRTSATLCH